MGYKVIDLSKGTPDVILCGEDPSDRAISARAKRTDFQLPKRELDEAVAEHE